MPRVLNLRSRGGVIPEGAVYVGNRLYRGPWRLPQSKWANPFRIDRDGSRDEVIAKYRDWIVQQPELTAALSELRGKDLACWCAPKRCHGEVLVELANR
jgi:hypothetical protein